MKVVIVLGAGLEGWSQSCGHREGQPFSDSHKAKGRRQLGNQALLACLASTCVTSLSHFQFLLLLFSFLIHACVFICTYVCGGVRARAEVRIQLCLSCSRSCHFFVPASPDLGLQVQSPCLAFMWALEIWTWVFMLAQSSRPSSRAAVLYQASTGAVLIKQPCS